MQMHCGVGTGPRMTFQQEYAASHGCYLCVWPSMEVCALIPPWSDTHSAKLWWIKKKSNMGMDESSSGGRSSIHCVYGRIHHVHYIYLSLYLAIFLSIYLSIFLYIYSETWANDHLARTTTCLKRPSNLSPFRFSYLLHTLITCLKRPMSYVNYDHCFQP